METNDDKKWLYGKFVDAGLNVGTYEDFDHTLQNEEDKQWYYDKATNMGLNIGSYDDFNKLFGRKPRENKKEYPITDVRNPDHVMRQPDEFTPPEGMDWETNQAPAAEAKPARRRRLVDYILGNAGSPSEQVAETTQPELRYKSDANGDLPQALKDAGLTTKDVQFQWTGGQSGAGYYTINKEEQQKKVDAQQEKQDIYKLMLSPEWKDYVKWEADVKGSIPVAWEQAGLKAEDIAFTPGKDKPFGGGTYTLRPDQFAKVVESRRQEQDLDELNDYFANLPAPEGQEAERNFIKGQGHVWAGAAGRLMYTAAESIAQVQRATAGDIADPTLRSAAFEEFTRREKNNEPLFRNDQTMTRAQRSVLSKEEYENDKKQRQVNQIINDLRDRAIAEGKDPEEEVRRMLDPKNDKSAATWLFNTANNIIEKHDVPLAGAAKAGAILPMVASMAGTIALAATGNEAAAKSLGEATLGMFAAEGAGGAMKQARDAGASNEQIVASGLASAAIMYGFAKLPLGRYFQSATTSSTAGAINASKGFAAEYQKLLKDAATHGVLNKETAAIMAKQWAGHTLESAGSFAAMSALSSLVPLIYETPKDYPVISTMLQSALQGAQDGLIIGSIAGAYQTGARVYQTARRWREKGEVYFAEVESTGDDIYFIRDKETGDFRPLTDSERLSEGMHFAELLRTRRDVPGNTRFGLVEIQTEDGNVYLAEPSVIRSSMKLDAKKATEETKNAYRDAGYDEGASAQTTEQKTGIRVNDEYLLRKAENEATQGGVSEGTQLDVDRANAAMEGRRDTMRTQLEQRIGKPFWTGANGSETVDVVELQDGRTVFVLSEDEKGVVGVDKDGKPVMIDKDSDNIYQRYLERLDEYLDAQVSNEDQIAEHERMIAEQADNVTAMIQKVQQDGRVNLSAEENPVWGTLVSVNPAPDGGITVQVEGEANPRFLNWKETSSVLGMPFEGKSNEDLVNDKLRMDDQVANYNENIPVDSELQVQMDGGDVVTYKFKDAEVVDGEVIVHGEDTESGEVVDILPEMVTNLDALVNGETPAPDVDGNPVPAASSPAPAPEETAPVFTDPVANELGIDKKYAHTTPSGEVVVDGRVLWNENPELWAEWNDRNPNRGISTKEYLEDKQQKATQEAQTALDAYKAEWKGNQDPDVLQTLKAEMDKKTDRLQRINDLVKKYDDAEKAAQLAKEQPAPVEEARPAFATQSATPKETLQNELSDIDARIKKSPVEQKQELLQQRNSSVQRYVDGARVYGDTEATTISELANRMTAEGVDRRTSVYVQDVIDRASKRGEVVRGVTITKRDGSRKAFLVSDNLRDAVDVNGALVHEEWHIANGSNGLIERLIATEGIDKNNMLAAISYWSRGSKHYDSNKSTEELADEYIAMAMEAIDGIADEGVAAELAKAGVNNEEIVNFVKTHRNERGLLQGVSDTRRDRTGYGNSSVSGPENGGDSIQRPEGNLGQSGPGSLGSSGDGTGAGEQVTNIENGRRGQYLPESRRDSLQPNDSEVDRGQDVRNPETGSGALEGQLGSSGGSRPSVGAGEEVESPAAEAISDRVGDNATPEEIRLNDAGVASNQDEGRFSVRYSPTEEQANQIAADVAKDANIPFKKAKEWVKSETSLAAIILDEHNSPYLNYIADDRYTAIKSDSDYPQGTVDFNNICRKRHAFTDMYQRIQKAFPNTIITGADLATIRQIMKEHGETVACGLCYVEDRRQLLGEIARNFIQELNGNFENYAKGGETKQKNAEKFRELLGDDRKDDLSIYDLLTLDGSQALYNEHPGIYNAFQAFNKARGQQSGNLFQGYAEYKREILKWTPAKVASVNGNGGLRVFSYSDFEAHHLIDLVQIIQDCARKGVMIQGYTKVPAFARAVANTGIKLNRSLIPLGDTGIVDGKLAYDPVEGIDINDPDFLESNDNVGNILIGINDEQIALAMLDPFVHYIIPYHSNQSGILRQMKQTGAWTNYKNEQLEKGGKEVNIYKDVLAAAEAEGKPIKNERQFVNKFLQVCRERGLTPRFSRFLNVDNNGNFAYRKGYYKLLLDFKLFDEDGKILPQKPVVAKFDDDFNAKILQDYVAGEESKGSNVSDEIYNEIVEKLGLERRGPGIQFSIVNRSQDVFVSNAQKAVEGIKMEKATPEQWLKMIENGGGLKAGEDKWIGLSDWLRGSDRKSLTKQEVSDFIEQNRIRIEEVKYGGSLKDEIRDTIGRGRSLDELQREIDEIRESEEYKEIAGDDIDDSLLTETMVDRYGDDFELGYIIDTEGKIDYQIDPFADEDFRANQVGDTRPIHNIRLGYTTEGLENNREIALTVPTIEPWNESDEIHFGDAGEGRAVAWIRFGDATVSSAKNAAEAAYREADKAWRDYRNEIVNKYALQATGTKTTKDLATPEENARVHELRMESDRLYHEWRYGRHPKEKVLVIDEIQSKRHQDAREKGYADKNSIIIKREDKGWSYSYADSNDSGFVSDLIAPTEEDARNHAARLHRGSVPAAPFEKNWHELAMKRMLRLAAEEGYDYVAWTTGDQQAERYNIGGVLNSIERRDSYNLHEKEFTLNLNSRGTQYITTDDDGNITRTIVGDYRGKTLSDLVGKELALRMLSMKEGDSIQGEGLRVGGEGMKGFYDDILPRFMNKYGKKWGTKVEDLFIPNIGEDASAGIAKGLTMHAVPVTEEMKESVMGGQPMFSIHGREVRYPESVTQEQRDAVEKNLTDYTNIESDRYKQAKKLAEDVVSRIESENEEKFGDTRREVERIDARLKELNSEKGRIFSENLSRENLPTLKAEEQTLKAQRTALQSTIKSVNPFSFEAKKQKDKAILDAGILDNSEWKAVAVVPSFEPDVREELMRMGWNGQDNTAYATEYGFVSHWLSHHPDMTETEVSADMLKNLYNPTVVGFDPRYEDTILFIRNGGGTWYTTAIKVNPFKNDGSLLFATTYKNKENPSKKLARTISLGHLKGAAASNQIHRSFDDHAANIGINSESAIDSAENLRENGGATFSIVADQDKINELDAGNKVKVYRSMQLIDGELYPPMSAKVGGELREPSLLGSWEQSEEHPELADKDGNFKLDKGNGNSLKAAYAPYFHSRLSPLNEQFSEAYNRPNLVIVEGEIPESELTSGYIAEGSKKSVGEHDWASGKVSNALAKQGDDTRKVILSRWFKPVRIVTNSEVADIIANKIGQQDITFPYNTVTPGLREELRKRGVRFEGWQGNKPKNVDEIIAGMKRSDNVIDYLFNGADSISGENDAKFSITAEDSQKLFDAAKERFGVTKNIKEAGYVLPDGAMLDFSGRHWSSGDTSWMNGLRQVDHRDISELEFEKDGNTPSGLKTDMSDFIRRGAIRIDSSGSINLATKPTAAQESVLRRLMESGNGYVWVDFGDGYESDHSVSYDGIKPDRIINDIRRYFNEGVKPESRTMFSIVSAKENDEYMNAVNSGDMDKAQELVDKAAEQAGYTIRGYHGTTHNFFIFDRSKGNAEGNWGKGFYFTTSEEDASANYGNENGPDLEVKIERLAENMEWMDGYEDMDYDARMEEARKMLTGDNPHVISAAIRMENPVIIDSHANSNETFFDFESGYNPETDEYEGEESGRLLDFINAWNEEMDSYEWEGYSVSPDEILEYGYDGLMASQLETKAREILDNADFRNSEGELASGEFLRAVFERMGFDGIIDNNVNFKFGTQRKYGRGMDGMDTGTTHIIAFNPSQIKQTDAVTYDDNGNVIPLDRRFDRSNDDIRFSVTAEEDAEYMEAANSGDEKKAGRLIEEAARRAGYNSPKLYHGSDAFGFTTIDSGAADDGVSFWATNKEIVAGSYTKLAVTRRPGTEVSAEEYEKAIEIADQAMDDEIWNFRSLIDKYFSEWYFGPQGNEGIRKIIMDANHEPGYGDGVYDVLEDYVVEAYDKYGEDFKGEYEDFADWEENSPEARKIFDSISSLEGLRNQLWEIENGDLTGGIYELYANTDNMFVVDAHGKDWNELHPEGLPKIERGQYKDVPYRTRDVVKWAKEHGYDGVIFKNIRDNGRYGRTEHSDVYAFLNPQRQVKSADPVTYDDSGNIIPLSERFNERNDDIRFSFLGEKGAAALDKADETTVRMHNKDIAYAMEEIDATALAIKMATGWERGADGQWRYEAGDVAIPKEKFEALKTGDKIRLGDIVEKDSEVMKAYPEIADFTLVVAPKKEGFYGQLLFDKKQILINRGAIIEGFGDDAADRANSTLTHEVQHAIQHIEGFAYGDNTSVKETTPVIEEAKTNNPPLYRMMKVFGGAPMRTLDKVGREKLAKVASGENGEKTGFDKLSEEMKDESRKLAEDLGNMTDRDFLRLTSDMLRLKTAAREEAASLYKRSAGEVEARNVQARRQLTDEQRRNILAESTEDVPRADQVIKKAGAAYGSEQDVRFSIKENDDRYREAVESGDTKTVRDMVMAAVKEAMPNTKVVDRKGNPKVVYHGTVAETPFREFNGRDIYMTSQNYHAKEYTHKRGGLFVSPTQSGRVMPVFVNLENPYVVDAGRRLWRNIVVDWNNDPVTTEDIAKYARENGYDGVIIKRVRDHMFDDDPTYSDDIIAFNSSQVKSAGPTYERVKNWHYPWDTFDDVKNEIGATYDENGDLIPLFERFNGRKSDINFSIRGDAEDLRRFNKEGLAGVIGEENVAPLMRSVYAAIPRSVKAPIVDKALTGMDFRKPLNEYLHDLAAKGTENDETGLLFAMYDEIRALTGNPELTDGDIRYMIWKSTGESNGDILSMAEDIAMKNRWNVGKDEPRFSVRKPDLTEVVEDAQEDLDKKVSEAEDKRKTVAEAVPHMADLLNPIVKSMAAQKEYDRATVDGIVDFAKQILKNGGVSTLTTREFNRLLTIIKSSTGKSPKSVTKYSDELLDKLIDHMVKDEQAKFDKLINVKDVRLNQSGVAAIGSLDVSGQITMRALRDYMFRPQEEIDNRIAEVENKFDSSDKKTREDARAEFEGLKLASDYQRDLAANIKEGNDLENELDEAKDAKRSGEFPAKEYAEFAKVTEQQIRENKIARVDLYRDFKERLSELQKGSKNRAHAFREAERERVERIHHLANLDMQGTPNKEHLESSWKSRALNSTGVRFFLKPLATFDQMLRLFGRSTLTGEGFLYNHFGRGWVDAREQELIGKEEAIAELDKKVKEIFDDPKMQWSKLYDKERKMKGATVYFFDGGEKVAHDLTPGNLLYIYMANKMVDGKMKLRRMGISEEDVQAIQRSLDPEFIELADWIQSEFLPKRRAKYNAVHEEMFGASMAAIDDYFPLKILSNARVENIDLADDPGASGLTSTTTGSIIKRQKNSLALDLLNTDAFNLVVEHVEEMENWAAFAKLRRDMNTLLSYKRFRNQVQNMDTVYGSGKVLWDNFRDVASIAMGNYRPKVGKQDIDTLALNVAKGVTGAKISFRIGTALKQFLSAPAFLSDARLDDLVKNLATAPKAWTWCMENLPIFRERWNSRFAGDTRLMKTESDWKLWKTKLVREAGKLGMSPNAFVDALTVAVGAKSMYDTNYRRYVEGGYSEEEADRKAKQDATILYNQTQQSSEAMFTSAMQLDRTLGSVMLTVFRNSSMGYNRQTHDALRIYGRMMQDGYKERAIERMTRQRMEDGLSEDEAKAFAEKEYNRQYWRSAARIGVFAFLLPLAWNYGIGDLLYLLFGDDDKEKEKIHHDALMHTLAGPVEGLTAGSVISSAWGTYSSTGKTENISLAELPIESDMAKILSMVDYDAPAAVAEIVNLIVQSGIGVNPQTFTDAIVATIDAFEGDMGTAKEFAIWLMRVNQLPQPSIERFLVDEFEMTPDEAKAARLEDLAKRYADYKMRKGAISTLWMYDPELEEKRRKSYEKKFKKKVTDRENLHVEDQENN